MGKARSLRQDFGNRLRQLRRARGWTQQDVAERAELDSKFIGGVERAERNITLETLEKIAAGFDLEVYELFFFGDLAEGSQELISEAKIRDLVVNVDPTKKRLMWRLLQEVAAWEADSQA